MRRPPEIPLVRALLLAVVSAAVLAACTDNDTAIFYYVENEQPVVDYSLDNDSTILGMARENDHYFASLGGSLWERAVGDTTWYKVSRPSGTAFCGPLSPFSVDSKVYVSLLVGKTWGLYSIDPTVQPFVLQPVANQGGIGGKQLTGLFNVNGRLFAAAMETETAYSLYSTDAPGTNPFVTAGISSAKPVTQVTYDGTQYYYAAAATRLLRGTAADVTGGTVNADVTPGAAGGAIITGVYFSTGYNRLYAATDEGNLLQSPPDLSAWASTGEIDVSGTTVRFTRIGEVGATPGNIVFGSMEHGVYQLFATGDVSSNDRLVDTTDSELYNGEVIDFYVDPVDATLVFALTGGSGLWHSTYSAPNFAEWVRE